MRIKQWERVYSTSRDDTGATVAQWHADLYTQPLWRVIAGPLLYWLDLHKPRWMEPGGGRPTSIDHGDGTCTFLWRLRLELWLGYDFHHRKRVFVDSVRIDRAPPAWIAEHNARRGYSPSSSSSPVDDEPDVDVDENPDVPSSSGSSSGSSSTGAAGRAAGA